MNIFDVIGDMLFLCYAMFERGERVEREEMEGLISPSLIFKLKK